MDGIEKSTCAICGERVRKLGNFPWTHTTMRSDDVEDHLPMVEGECRHGVALEIPCIECDDDREEVEQVEAAP